MDNQKFQLRKIMTVETVRAQVHAESWQQAAAMVGELLVNENKVTPQYVRKMIQSLEEIGPYVVIAPGIALLHARPENGVLEPCVGLITLEEPVAFGHSENDPVDIVFAFGATDKESHIPALQQLSERIGNLQSVEKIRAANSDQELLEAFVA